MLQSSYLSLTLYLVTFILSKLYLALWGEALCWCGPQWKWVWQRWFTAWKHAVQVKKQKTVKLSVMWLWGGAITPYSNIQSLHRTHWHVSTAPIQRAAPSAGEWFADVWGEKLCHTWRSERNKQLPWAFATSMLEDIALAFKTKCCRGISWKRRAVNWKKEGSHHSRTGCRFEMVLNQCRASYSI